jgi:hypothetical protein
MSIEEKGKESLGQGDREGSVGHVEYILSTPLIIMQQYKI